MVGLLDGRALQADAARPHPDASVRRNCDVNRGMTSAAIVQTYIATAANVCTRDTRLPRDPGIRRHATTSALPISIPAHLLTITSIANLRPPSPYPAVEPGGITRVNDAVRRAQSKQFAVPNAIPGSVFTPDSQHQENPSSPEPTRHHSHAIAAATGHPSLYWYRGEAQFTDGSLADGGPAGFEAGDR